jgi:VanZ family protein
VKPERRRFLLYWLPPLGWAATIFVQSSFRVAIDPPSGFELSDKALHAAVYALLAWLLLRALLGARHMALARAAWWAFLVSALYGATDELHQGLVPSRTMEWGDWLADVAGAATVFLLLPVVWAAARFRGTPVIRSR